MVQAERERDADSELDILMKEVTPLMRIEGGCILRGIAEHDPDLLGLSFEAQAAIVYSRMRMAQNRELAARHNKADSAKGKRAVQ